MTPNILSLLISSMIQPMFIFSHVLVLLESIFSQGSDTVLDYCVPSIFLI